MNARFTDVDVAALLRIAGEAGELAHDLHPRRAHILGRLLGLVGGTAASCSEMDASYANASGWAVPDTITFAAPPESGRANFSDRDLAGRLSALDPSVPALLRREKPVVASRREDGMEGAWYRSEQFNEMAPPPEFAESVYGILTLPDGRRVKLTFHRDWRRPPFTERDVRLLHVFNQNLASLYLATASAPSAPAPRDRPPGPDGRIASLPPRLRPVLRRLLAGDAEKQAAAKLGLSPHTVHEYTKVLYRTFGVNSRGELLAKFVANG